MFLIGGRGARTRGRFLPPPPDILGFFPVSPPGLGLFIARPSAPSSGQRPPPGPQLPHLQFLYSLSKGSIESTLLDF